MGVETSVRAYALRRSRSPLNILSSVQAPATAAMQMGTIEFTMLFIGMRGRGS
ncbi:MAG TPA: hypothetical protein VFC78_12620 [Tepidisphaeraceae bacterium]|nr:hypothetical protein [Tepidisphaeraceae bacterium]